jgi:phospholipid/cholesterol/gamma-HCH transport system substrate-binding protein
METRANHVWVGTVTLAMLALLAGVAIWMAHLSKEKQDIYDIYFPQSVDGLAKGSSVSYAGVPAGQITQIELWKRDPSYVRVRVALDDHIPILQGTTATIQGSFTGVSNIQLAGGVKGKPPITEIGPDGVPVIPTKRSGLGELLSNAPLLMERLAGLTEKLADMLSDENQKHLAGILKNTDKLTANLAAASPQLKDTLVNLSETLVGARDAVAQFQKVAASADRQLDPEGPSVVHHMNDTLAAAQKAAESLQAELDAARPATTRLSTDTLPQAEAAIHDLRATTKALRAITEKLDNQGGAALLAAPKVPVYKP